MPWIAGAVSLALHGAVLGTLLLALPDALTPPPRERGVEILWEDVPEAALATGPEERAPAPPPAVAAPSAPPAPPEAMTAPPAPPPVPPPRPVARAAEPPPVPAPAPPSPDRAEAVPLPPLPEPVAALPAPPPPPAPVQVAEALPVPADTAPAEEAPASEPEAPLPLPPPPIPPPPQPAPRPAEARPTEPRPAPQPLRITSGIAPLGPQGEGERQAAVAGASRATGAVVPPGLLDGHRNPQPDYPQLSRLRGEQGVVGLVLRIAPSGQVMEVEIGRSSGFPLLDEAARQAAQRWRFRPALRDGIPVEGTIRTAVHFRLVR